MIHDDNPESPELLEAEGEAVIAEYFTAVAAGLQPDRGALLSAHPELADDLQAFFNSHDQLAQLSSWWRSAVDGGGPSGRTIDGDETTPLEYREASAGPPELPDYEILEEIARGGMGVVYRARQKSLNRIVAIKMILQGRLAAAADRQRFKVEAAAAAKLKHPHIVVIHEVGEHAGHPFFSMEYVAGESLAKVIRRGMLPAKQVARYVQQVAHAVQCAHDHGVLHRDIKPSNVLIDQAGLARVTDFGLAKEVDAGDQLTMSGQLLGTPSYMAPEQISGPKAAVGPSVDIYGLGALLYELITGRPPFRGESGVETLLEALESMPQLPRRLNPNVPRELEMIALKCLEKDPRNRYGSAQAVADDLARYMEGDSISISSPNLLDRLVRTLERSHYDREFHTWSRMLLAVAAIALATHAGVFFYQWLNLPKQLAGIVAIRSLEIVAMSVVMWRVRQDWYPPRGAAARQLWSVWLGYMTGSTVLLLVAYLSAAPGEPLHELAVYPSMAVLASLAFIMLGSSYWGYCYAMGGAFLALAVVMTLWPAAAPLAFGLCWGASLATLGIRLGRLARE